MRKEIFISKMLKCRATHADFVIPYQKYVKIIMNPICIGTRFKMRFEMDDSPERRYCMSPLHSMTIIIFLLVMIYSHTVVPFLILKVQWCSDWNHWLGSLSMAKLKMEMLNGELYNYAINNWSTVFPFSLIWTILHFIVFCLLAIFVLYPEYEGIASLSSFHLFAW